MSMAAARVDTKYQTDIIASILFWIMIVKILDLLVEFTGYDNIHVCQTASSDYI